MLRHISPKRSKSLLPTGKIRSYFCSSSVIAVNRSSTFSSCRRRQSLRNLCNLSLRILPNRQPQLSFVGSFKINVFSNAAAIVEEDDDDTDGNILNCHEDIDRDSDNNDQNNSRTKKWLFNDDPYIAKLILWFEDDNNNNCSHGLTSKKLRDAFYFERMQNPPVSKTDVPNLEKFWTVTQWWTAEFVNPVTNDRFVAKDLPDIPFLQIDGKYFYMKKRHATIAAAAHFLQEKEQVQVQVTISSELSPEEVEKLSMPSHHSPFRDSKNGSSPRSRLQHEYAKHSILPTNNNFHIIQHQFCGEEGKEGFWWTATFQCPVTFQRYAAANLMEITSDNKMEHAGRIWYKVKNNAIHAASARALEVIDWTELSNETHQSKDSSSIPIEHQRLAELESILQPLLNWYKQEHGVHIDAAEMETTFVLTNMSTVDNAHRWTASFICPMTGERFDAGKINAVSSIMVDQVMWYDQKNFAIQAAAQSAYDILHHRKTRQSSPRFCNEDPATRATPLEVADTEVESLASSVDECIGMKASVGNCDLGDDQKSDNDDEFVIELIPQQTGFGRYHRSPTLDIIAQTWIESTTMLSNENGADKRIDNTEVSMRRRQEAMNRAMTWLEEQNEKPKHSYSGKRTFFDSGGRMNGLNIVNVILASLAETHQRVPFDSQPVGVEKAATAILDSMMVSEECTPDADTYAYYIKCLEGETVEDIAQRADEIVSAMERGRDKNDRPLPKPNALVYASLLQVKAIAGNFALYQHIDAFHPTRETFLASLSAMAHDTTKFKVDLATPCVNLMAKLAEELSDSSLQPDTEVFNAPLRWSGGAIAARRFSRAIPWDSYSDIFSGGFLSDDSSTNAVHDQAREMERWLGYLQTQGYSPSIETFESIIQAWVRCGTTYGLHQAEEYCERLIHGDIPSANPRLQTFYPVLAAWTYSGSTESLENVNKWLLKIQELSQDLNSHRRFVSLPFLSLLATQKQFLSRARDKESQESMHQAREVAWTCSHIHLAAVVDDLKASSSFFLPHEVFLLTTQAWYNVASTAKSMDDLVQGFDGLQQNVDIFEDLVMWLYNNHTEQTKYQLVHLLEHAPSIYSAHLSALEEFSRVSKTEDRGCDATCHLLAIEEKIRRSREILQFLEERSGDALDQKLDYGDSKVFPFESVLRASFCKNWADYRSKAIEILEALVDASKLHHPDLIRLVVEMAHMKDSLLATKQVLGFLKVLLNRGWAETDRETILQTLKILERAAGDQDNDRRLCSNGEVASKEDPIFDNKGRRGKEQSAIPCSLGETDISLTVKKTRPRRNRSRGSASSLRNSARRYSGRS